VSQNDGEAVDAASGQAGRLHLSRVVALLRILDCEVGLWETHQDSRRAANHGGRGSTSSVPWRGLNSDITKASVHVLREWDRFNQASGRGRVFRRREVRRRFCSAGRSAVSGPRTFMLHTDLAVKTLRNWERAALGNVFYIMDGWGCLSVSLSLCVFERVCVLLQSGRVQ
jgi:hypothetical protein